MVMSLVLREDVGGLATLTLNRPDKLNCLNTAMFEALSDHVNAIALETDSVGCVVVRGAGRAFSAGHDLGSIGEETGAELNFQAHVVKRLANLPQPVISAVHGHCYTGALELALAGDIVLAAQAARFADTHAKWGLTPIWGMSQRLPRRIGGTKAREMMFSCRTVTGAEAATLGLANACYADQDFDGAVERFAREVLDNSWFSNFAIKRLLIETDGLPLSAGLSYEIARNRGNAPDVAERITHFSKRKA